MSGFFEYDSYDAAGLAELVRKKEVSAGELLSEAIERCDRVNPRLNAVIHRCDSEAERSASSADPSRPLAGVPFLIKDLGPALAGAPLTSGSRLFARYVPTEDGEIVKRFKAAGLTIFGKTNIPEFGLVPATESELHGPCRNPWDINRTPGGSSGGAASAVAAGIVPVAHASDGGGSIRIPASCCGLVGLKPSRGLNPKESQPASITESFGVDHVVSRSVRDSAALLDAVCNQPNAGFLAGLETAPSGLRVAVVRSAMLGASVAPEMRSALDQAAKLLEGLGHHVEDAEPRVDYAEAGMAFLTYWAVGAMQTLDDAERVLGRQASKGDVELATWTLAKVGRIMSDDDISRARVAIAKVTGAFADFLARYDILVSPVLAAPPLAIGQNRIKAAEKIAIRLAGGINSPWLMKALLRQVAAKNFAFAAFTAPFNLTGQPAISVPLHWTSNGLPAGIQLAARTGADALLLRLARQLELAQPWSARRPRVWAQG
jgi:Asp-tRNA(Asn)/Glu-tRNA(Gln) amidotransferase A subunit family amidase